MAHLRYMPELKRAFISGKDVTSTGAKHLAGLRKLKTVCLTGTRVGDEGIRRFGSLEDLEQLYLTHTQVTEEGVRQLEESLPDCKVSRLEELTNSIGMRFVLIPAGEFVMGSPAGDGRFEDEHPQHRVRITKPFYVGVHEVTQEQYATVMGSHPWSGKPYVKDGADSPATYVGWEDAVAFCEKLSEKEGCTYRLPTEAEWEYSCRAGSTTRYCFGDDSSALDYYAWHHENAASTRQQYPRGVGQKKPSGWGLYDIHGNLLEWCADYYDERYYKESPVEDPTGPSPREFRVLRSTCWAGSRNTARSAQRVKAPLDNRGSGSGFRVVRTP